MSHERRRAGILYFKVDSELYDAKGNFTYNLGMPKREAILGCNAVHGYKETMQAPFIEGEVTDRKELDLKKLITAESATVTLELSNGKVIVLRDAWYAGEGTGNTEEANIAVRFEGISAEEVR